MAEAPDIDERAAPEAAPAVLAPRSRLGLALKVLAVLVVVGLVVAAWQLGAFEKVRHPEQLKAYLLELGVVGWIVFVSIFALLQPFGLPGVSLVIVAPLVWPWYTAFGLSMVGGTLATIVGFSFARFVARDAVAKRIPQRFRKYDQRLAERAFTTILLLRTIFWVHPLLHIFFGTSKVKFRTHVLASALAYIVPFFVISFFGERVLDLVKEVEGWHWLVAAIVAVKLGVVAWSVRRWFTRKKTNGAVSALGDAAAPRESRLATSSE